ncbi:hypothetical protein AAMO2058_000016700 [Amorphochlora amoebiformis]
MTRMAVSAANESPRARAIHQRCRRISRGLALFSVVVSLFFRLPGPSVASPSPTSVSEPRTIPPSPPLSRALSTTDQSTLSRLRKGLFTSHTPLPLIREGGLSTNHSASSGLNHTKEGEVEPSKDRDDLSHHFGVGIGVGGHGLLGLPGPSDSRFKPENRISCSHKARLGGGYIEASRGINEAGRLLYYIRTTGPHFGGRQVMLGRVELYESPGDAPEILEEALDALLGNLAGLFPGCCIQTLLQFTPSLATPSLMYSALKRLAASRNFSLNVQPIPGFTAESRGQSPGDSGETSGVHGWDLAVLAPMGKETGRAFGGGLELPVKGGEVTIRQAESAGGGILYADVHEAGIVAPEAGRLIFHERGLDQPVRIAFLHVKASHRNKKIATALLDHLKGCLFPERDIQVIFQSARHEIPQAWATFKSFAVRHSLACYKYPTTPQSVDILRDPESRDYQPGSFEILHFGARRDNKTTQPWQPLLPPTIAAFNSTHTLIKEFSRLLHPRPPKPSKSPKSLQILPFPPVVRLNPSQIPKLRNTIQQFTRHVARVDRIRGRNPEIGSEGCLGAHPVGGGLGKGESEESVDVIGRVSGCCELLGGVGFVCVCVCVVCLRVVCVV